MHLTITGPVPLLFQSFEPPGLQITHPHKINEPHFLQARHCGGTLFSISIPWASLVAPSVGVVGILKLLSGGEELGSLLVVFPGDFVMEWS